MVSVLAVTVLLLLPVSLTLAITLPSSVNVIVVLFSFTVVQLLPPFVEYSYIKLLVLVPPYWIVTSFVKFGPSSTTEYVGTVISFVFTVIVKSVDCYHYC